MANRKRICHQSWPAICLLAVSACSRLSGDLQSPIPETRAAAVEALGSAGHEDDLPALLVAQRDPSALVRKAAVSAFTARGGVQSVNALGKLLSDPDAEVAAAAAHGLGVIPRLLRSTDALERDALQKRARLHLISGYGNAGPGCRTEIASSLRLLGASLREAVEAESRQLWERNLRALADGTVSERCGAVEELGRSGRTEVVQRLLPLLDVEPQKNRALAAAAARGLGATGDYSVRPNLEKLLEQSDATLAQAAAEALGELGDPAAAVALARIGSVPPFRRAQAALTALSRLPQASEVEVSLCEIALRAPDQEIARRAALLIQLRDAGCPERPLLTRISRRGPDAAGALAVVTALGLSDARARAAGEVILPLAVSPPADPTLKVAVADALGKLEYAPGVPALLRWSATLLQKETSDAEELAAVTVALAHLKAEKAAELAFSLTSHANPTVRAKALEALGFVRSDAARERLVQALADPDLTVRSAAAEALTRFGARSTAVLSEALQHSRPAETSWRIVLIHALGEIASPESVAHLAKVLDGAEAPAAAMALGRTGRAEAVKPLLAILERPQARARLETIDALATLAPAGAGPALTVELTSDRPEIRAAAVRALGRLRFEGASALLEALRSDYYGEVRRAAVDALARLPVHGTGTR